jgi:hypothetical protein
VKVGFTGSRDGMSQFQKEQLVVLLSQMEFVEFHHGDCKGADAEAHDIVREFFPHVRIHVHPPKIEFMRAFKEGDVMYEPDEYLPRDERIVNITDLLIGAPKNTDFEEKRSGSWYTIRYARRKQKAHHVLSRSSKV